MKIEQELLTFRSCRLQSRITVFSKGEVLSRSDVKFLYKEKAVINEENEANLHIF